MEQPPDRFETARLVLRRGTVADAPALFEAYASDPQATRYLSWRTHESVFETEEFLDEAANRWERGDEYTWVLQQRSGDRAIGMLGAVPGMHGVEIGYVIGRDWWGQGLVAEAVTPVMEWLRGQTDVFRVWAYCAVEHRRSARVLERSGMRYEATLRRWVRLPNFADEPCDALIYCWARPGAC